MSADDIAKAAKDNLQSSLLVTHNLTFYSAAAPDFIMNKMNEVLRACYETNFNVSASMAALGGLYAAIGQAQPLMVDHAQNIALVNLSRSFAVVLEDAIRSRAAAGEGEKNNNNNNNNGWTQFNNNAGWSSNGNGGGKGDWEVPASVSSGPWGAASQSVSSTQVSQSGGQQGESAAQKGFGTPSSQQFTNGFGGLPASTTAARPVLSPSQEAAARAARAAKEAKKDYSPEAREGRITVYKVPLTVTELQLRAHFTQIGVITEMSYPLEKGKRKGFALIKYADNAAADAAVSHLDGKHLGGAPLEVRRASYWFKKEPAVPAFGTGGANSAVTVASVPAARRTAPSISSSSTSHAESYLSRDYSVKAPDTSLEDEEVDEQSSEDDGSDPGIM